jgi:glycerol-3-phosphate acyltransferase PlsX
MTTLSIDCMGGDHGPSVTLVACAKFLDAHPEAKLLLVGLPERLNGFSHPRATIVPASEVVAMDDPIEIAMRKKKDSSMRVAIQQVKNGAADVAVSAGNTGALMALARYLLKTLEGIDRPALAAAMPNAKDSSTTVLDLGANVDCGPEHLLQFAVMGSALVSALSGNENPTVGLLNIGEEIIKGNENIKKTGELLRSAGKAGDLNFLGNVEGDDIYKGRPMWWSATALSEMFS